VNVAAEELDVKDVMPPQQMFACDTKTLSWRFMAKNHPNTVVFSKNADTMGIIARDINKDQIVLVPDGRSKLNMTGWVCRTKSKLNPKRKTFTNIIQDEVGETGETFAEYARSIAKRKVFASLGENVVGLLESEKHDEETGELTDDTPLSNMGQIEERFATLGYELCYHVLDPSVSGWPQSRERCYIAVVQAQELAENLVRARSSLSVKDVMAGTSALAIKLNQMKLPIPLASLLLENDDPLVLKMLGKHRHPKRAKIDSVWLEAHKTAYSQFGYEFVEPSEDTSLNELYENEFYAMLPDPQKSIIRLVDLVHPLLPGDVEEAFLVCPLNRYVSRACKHGITIRCIPRSLFWSVRAFV
jgi:site-specific DNA-cytosine methylase